LPEVKSIDINTSTLDDTAATAGVDASKIILWLVTIRGEDTA
jgi:hypothetical protein